MKLWCVGIIRPNITGQVLGYVIADIDKTTTATDDNGGSYTKIADDGMYYFPTNAVLLQMSRGFVIENMSYNKKYNTCAIVSGSVEQYATFQCVGNPPYKMIGVGRKQFTNPAQSPSPIIVVGRDSSKRMVRCLFATGRIMSAFESTLIADVDKNGRVLSNAMVVDKDGTRFIRSKAGELEDTASTGTQQTVQKPVQQAPQQTVTQPKPVQQPVAQAQKPVQQTAVQPPKPTEPPRPTTQQLIEEQVDNLFILKYVVDGYCITGIKDAFDCDRKTTVELDFDKLLIYLDDTKLHRFMYKGVPVKYIDSLAFYAAIDRDSYRYATEHNRQNLYLFEVDNVLARIELDHHAKGGFGVIDSDGMYEVKVISTESNVVEATLRVPAFTIDRQGSYVPHIGYMPIKGRYAHRGDKSAYADVDFIQLEYDTADKVLGRINERDKKTALKTVVNDNCLRFDNYMRYDGTVTCIDKSPKHPDIPDKYWRLLWHYGVVLFPHAVVEDGKFKVVNRIGWLSIAGCAPDGMNVNVALVGFSNVTEIVTYSLTTFTRVDLSRTQIKFLPEYAATGFSLSQSSKRRSGNVTFNARVKTVELNKSIVKIHKKAFYGCEELIGIVIPASVNEIGSYAFAYSKGLSVVKCEQGTKLKIQSSAFAGCISLQEFDFNCVSGLSTSSFASSGLKGEITINKDIRVVPKDCFKGCRGITTLNLAEGVEEFGADAIGNEGNFVINVPHSLKSVAGLHIDNHSTLAVNLDRGCSSDTAWQVIRDELNKQLNVVTLNYVGDVRTDQQKMLHNMGALSGKDAMRSALLMEGQHANDYPKTLEQILNS